MEKRYITVSALNRYLKAKVDQDQHLKRILIQGEISNFKAHQSGHLYFTLKDENARVSAVMFSSYASKLKIKLQDGLKVLIVGSLSVYENAGNFQLYVYSIDLDGLGQLYLAYEQLKKELYAKGVFDVQHKQKIPLFPNKIGVICAKPSAALEDILKTINSRYPLAKVFIFPSLVQGNEAYLDIIKKIDQAESYDLDVLIIARGGGSIEDLWNFNNEQLIYKVFNAKTPIISGVGHESDTTLIDYVADKRAPTPTAAAVLATPDYKELIESIEMTKSYLGTLINYKLINYKQRIQQLSENRVLKNCDYIFKDYNLKIEQYEFKLKQLSQQKLDTLKHSFEIQNTNLMHMKQQLINDINYQLVDIEKTLKQFILGRLEHDKIQFTHLLEQMDLVSPLNLLKKGYSLVMHNNHIINSSSLLKENDEINIVLDHGEVIATVKEIKNGKNFT